MNNAFFGITLQSIGLFAIMVGVFYVSIIGFVMADLRSGVRKSVKAGMYRSSKKYRDTINKLNQYFLLAFAITLLDCVLVFGICCLDYDWYPHFPFATMAYAIVIGCIEIKSIYEKFEDKQKMDIAEASIMLAKLAQEGKLGEVKEALTILAEKAKEKNNPE